MINKSDPLPLVYQAEDYICRIIAEKYPAGSLIPTQNELADALGVSRITVRNAVEALKKKGILDSCRGKGTVVVVVPETTPLPPSELFDFPMIQRTEIERAICGRLTVEADASPPPFFPPHALHLKVDRLYYKGDRPDAPLAMEECWWNGDLLPADAQRAVLHRDRSLYAQLEEQFGVKVSRCKESIEPRMAGENHCVFFRLPGPAPLLCIKRLSYVEDKLFEYRETLIRHEDFGIFVYKANK